MLPMAWALWVHSRGPHTACVRVNSPYHRENRYVGFAPGSLLPRSKNAPGKNTPREKYARELLPFYPLENSCVIER
jgi:hypothetical protein